jgi:hypothetical protein
MRDFRLIDSLVVVILLAPAPLGLAAEATTHEGPHGYSLIRTADDASADINAFLPSGFCGICHERELKELRGSMHPASHTDPFYRGLAELARKEAGDKTYTYCSGCHSPAGVVSGFIPAEQEPDLPPAAKDGVACDVCHQISRLTGVQGPWQEPGNASFVLAPGRTTRFGDTGQVAKNSHHTGEKRDFFAKSEFCASCHTVIHPVNGLHIEHTYGEWKSSVYAEKGIQCQDCHMRSVEDAVKVAETLQAVVVKGQRAKDGPVREIHPHFFVGGNANADRLAGGTMHAKMAEERLKSAARIEIKAPAAASAGQDLPLEVVVHNVAAGHNLPTGVTELRQMWVDLRILDQSGETVFRRGKLDDRDELPPDAIWFGSVAADLAGKVTVKQWEMRSLIRNRTVPPKSFLSEKVLAKLPADVAGRITVEAVLLYRSASPGIVSQILGEEAFTPKIVEMSKTRITVSLTP